MFVAFRCGLVGWVGGARCVSCFGVRGYFLASRFEGVQANPQTPAPKKQGSRVRFRIVIVSSMDDVKRGCGDFVYN